MDFNAAKMASGAAGADLKRLYDELKKYDSENTGSKGIADQMDFGHLRGNVNSQIQAKFVGGAYGISKRWNIFVGVPFIQASVDADLAYDGQNNAQAVKNRLGNVAFQEIKDGLDKASRLSAQDAKDKIQNENLKNRQMIYNQNHY